MSKENTLDFRGSACPDPIIKTIRRLTKIRSGESLTIYVDSEECLELIKNTLELISVSNIVFYRENNYWVIRIVK